MKKHILSKVGKKAKMLLKNTTFYDFCQQISFWDSAKTIPVFNATKEGTILETSTIENSDPDEFAVLGPGTVITEQVENSDVDEFSLDFSGSRQTRTIEDSDIDSIISFSSKITKSLENSDADEFIPSFGTKQTFTQENSDVDEFSLGY